VDHHRPAGRRHRRSVRPGPPALRLSGHDGDRIIGGLLGGFLWVNVLDQNEASGWLGALVIATLGSVLVILVLRAVSGPPLRLTTTGASATICTRPGDHGRVSWWP